MLASETGVLDDRRPRTSCARAACSPGKMFLVDLEQGRIVEDEEVKREVATPQPVRRVVRARASSTSTTCPSAPPRVPRIEPLRARQLAFGYTQEDLRVILAPMARNAEEPIGSMGNDLALAVLSDQRPLLYSYFKQLFAQVTNPPIDPIREDVVMSVGDERRLRAQPARRDARARPPARDRPADPRATRELESLRQVALVALQGAHARHHLAGRGGRRRAWRPRSSGSAREADEALADGANILILSDRNLGAERVAIPALLAVAARPPPPRPRRARACRPGLVVESGEPREVHHFATLIGYGAAAINPYVMFESLDELADDGLAAGGR